MFYFFLAIFFNNGGIQVNLKMFYWFFKMIYYKNKVNYIYNWFLHRLLELKETTWLKIYLNVILDVGLFSIKKIKACFGWEIYTSHTINWNNLVLVHAKWNIQNDYKRSSSICKRLLAVHKSIINFFNVYITL